MHYKQRLTKEDITKECQILSARTGFQVSSHCENGQYVIELGEVHVGRTVFRGPARACLNFLAGFEEGVMTMADSVRKRL